MTLHTYECTLCSNTDCKTRCVVETEDSAPPFECPYSEFDERGQAMTIGASWRLIQRKCGIHGWTLSDGLEECPLCERERELGRVLG